MEHNKRIARRALEDFFTQGDMALADELYAPTYRHHDPSSPEFVPGPEGMRQLVTMYRIAFPDISMTVEDQIAEGDTVVTRWTGRGTHHGELMGIAPTGRQTMVSGMSIWRIANGQIVEGWINWDAMSLLQQLGVVPTLDQTEA